MAQPHETLDHETRANRYLDAIQCLRDMLGHASPGVEVNACELSQLLGVLNDEARAVIIPFKPEYRGCNDDDDA